MAQLFSNNSIARIVSNISPIATSIYIDPARADMFPNPTHIDDFFLVTLDDINNPDIFEIVKISHRTGNQLHVAERGYEDTSPLTWQIDDTICDHRVTAGTLDSFLPVVKLKHIAIPQGTWRVIDAFDPSSENVSFKWNVMFTMPDIGKVQSFELHAIFRNWNSTVSNNKFAIMGDTMNVTVTVEHQAPLVKLKIMNLDSHDLVVNALRIQHL